LQFARYNKNKDAIYSHLLGTS